ncbi:MAG: hypothetical protein JXB14_00455 [Candidatus Altiarchaeota archaeon]|nr:hypothetical protein [Candidatus Altiarchaeota archaeon]
MQVRRFLEDDRGVYSMGFKLALAVMVSAAVLSLLVTLLGSMQADATTVSENLEDARRIAVDKSTELIQK